MENIIEFSHPEDPLPFADSFGDDLDAEGFDNYILSVHADNSFTIPAQSEVVVIGRLSSIPKGVNTSASEIHGLVTPKSDLPHRYSVFGASELVKVSSDATIPFRMVNPSAQPLKIFRRTKLAGFERVDNDVATFPFFGCSTSTRSPLSTCRLACVASVSVRLRSNEGNRKVIVCLSCS